MYPTDTVQSPGAAAAPLADRQLRRIVIASVAGNAMEWYDFFVYGTAAALVFGHVFFPPAPPRSRAASPHSRRSRSASSRGRSAGSCSATSAIATGARRRSSGRC